MRMLAMNIHQHLTDFAQLGDGGGYAIDECFGTATAINHPSQQ